MIAASPRRLSVFKCVVETGGFNLASQHLGIAQPSVGAHIKALEAEVGQPLFFRRRGSRPALTRAGETLYAYAVETLSRSEETANALADLRATSSLEISLALNRDVAPHMLATHLSVFAARFPKIRMITRTGTIEDIIELTRRHVAHLGFVIGSGYFGGLHSEFVSHLPLCLIVSPTHPLARRSSVSPIDIAQFPFYTGLRQSRYTATVREAMRKAGIDDLNIAMEVQDSPSTIEMVRRGHGIAALPSCAVEHDIASGKLAVLKLDRQLQDFELRCIYHRPLPTAAEQYLTFLRERIGPGRSVHPHGGPEVSLDRPGLQSSAP